MIKLLLTFTMVMAAAHMGLGGLIHSHDEDVVGDWDITLKVVGGQAQGTMTFRLDGKKLTGTVTSAHTGPGTVEGKIDGGKLVFTAVFEKHESIDFTGSAAGGKLQGEFRTEGNVGSWVGLRHGSTAETATASALPSRSTLDGEWNATLSGNGATAPLELKLAVNGEKVSGTFVSEHLGSGAVDGTFKGGKLALTLRLAKSSVDMTGTFYDGKLGGDFGSGPMKGSWTAVPTK